MAERSGHTVSVTDGAVTTACFSSHGQNKSFRLKYIAVFPHQPEPLSGRRFFNRSYGRASQPAYTILFKRLLKCIYHGNSLPAVRIHTPFILFPQKQTHAFKKAQRVLHTEVFKREGGKTRRFFTRLSAAIRSKKSSLAVILSAAADIRYIAAPVACSGKLFPMSSMTSSGTVL